MSLLELLSILKNHAKVSADINEIAIDFKETTFNNRPILEIEIEDLGGKKNFEVQFKQVFKHATT